MLSLFTSLSFLHSSVDKTSTQQHQDVISLTKYWSLLAVVLTVTEGYTLKQQAAGQNILKDRRTTFEGSIFVCKVDTLSAACIGCPGVWLFYFETWQQVFKLFDVLFLALFPFTAHPSPFLLCMRRSHTHTHTRVRVCMCVCVRARARARGHKYLRKNESHKER